MLPHWKNDRLTLPTKHTTLHSQIRQIQPIRYGLVTLGLLLIVLTGCASSAASTPTGFSTSTTALLIVLLVLIVVGLIAAPVVYFALNRQPRLLRSLLMVSTDEDARKVVMNAAKRAGYATIHVYRYEDALEKLRQDAMLSMIIIDDSVPQYEAGLLVSMLARLPIGIRPLILIHDSSELGATAPSYRAEAVVSRPLTEKAVEAAIRQVSEKIELTL